MYLDRVEPAKGGERHKQQDGPRSPLGERVAFLGDFWIGSAWGGRSRLFSGHFGNALEGVRGRGAGSKDEWSEPSLGLYVECGEPAVSRPGRRTTTWAREARRVASPNKNAPRVRPVRCHPHRVGMLIKFSLQHWMVVTDMCRVYQFTLFHC